MTWRICLAVAFLAALLAAPATASASDGDAAGELASCIKQPGATMRVVALVDQSRSMRSSDPDNSRAQGLTAALDALATIGSTARADGTKPDIQVAIDGFSNSVSKGEWTALNSDNLSAVKEEVRRVATRNDGHNTNFAPALQGAREQMLSAKDQNSGPVCRAVILMTDGKLDIRVSPSSSKHATGAESAAVKKLCKPDGILNQLASDGILRFTLALHDPAHPNGMSPEAVAMLRALTFGDPSLSANGQRRSCGTRLNRATGEFVDIANADQLFVDFATILDGGGSTAHIGPASFNAVWGVQRFVINAHAPDGRIRLVSPVNQAALICHQSDAPGCSSADSLSGVSLHTTWTGPETVTVEGELPIDKNKAAEVNGVWNYSFPGAKGNASAYSRTSLYAYLSFDLVNAGRTPKAVRGEENNWDLALVAKDSDGKQQPVDAGPLLAQSRLDAVLEDPDGNNRIPATESKPAPGRFRLTSFIPADSTAAKLRLRATLTFETGGSVTIVPEPRYWPLTLVFPSRMGYPSISPADVNLGNLSGSGTVKSTVTVAASPKHAGTACVSAATAEGPDGNVGNGAYSVSYEGLDKNGCMALKPGESRSLGVAVKVRDGSLGTLKVGVPVQLSSDVKGVGKQTITLPAHAELHPASHPFVKLIFVIFLTIVGVLIPLGVLYLINKRNAKFERLNDLYSLTADVVVNKEGIFSQSSGELNDAGELIRFEPTMDEADPWPGPGGTADSIDVFDGLEITATPMGSRRSGTFALRNLIGRPFGIVRPGRGLLAVTGASGDGARKLRQWDGLKAELPLVLGGAWVFVSADGQVEPDGDSENNGGELGGWDTELDDAAENLPEIDLPNSESRQVSGTLTLFVSEWAFDGAPLRAVIDDASYVLRDLLSRDPMYWNACWTAIAERQAAETDTKSTSGDSVSSAADAAETESAESVATWDDTDDW